MRPKREPMWEIALAVVTIVTVVIINLICLLIIHLGSALAKTTLISGHHWAWFAVVGFGYLLVLALIDAGKAEKENYDDWMGLFIRPTIIGSLVLFFLFTALT